MDRVNLRNYRCFREEQTVRLAPLTLLVGENSTGKTSFLALLRALFDVSFGEIVPDFGEPPYNLGTFNEIVNETGRGESRLNSFEAGFAERTGPTGGEELSISVEFQEHEGFPFPAKTKILLAETWFSIDQHLINDMVYMRFGTDDYSWESHIPSLGFSREWGHEFRGGILQAIPFLRSQWTGVDELRGGPEWRLMRGSQSTVPGEIVLQGLARSLARMLDWLRLTLPRPRTPTRTFAGAPVRSHPRRTYDLSRPSPDPEGEYVPSYLAGLSRRNPDEWKLLKVELEKFGRGSGLFEEISINSLGPTNAGPFQVHISRLGDRGKVSRRNLIDVGYGVSQALPLIAELLRSQGPTMFLLQQPEVHLHPSAQAALGSLFCSVAGRRRRQLVVETHSDYIIDRVRIDVRDRESDLRPEYVSILFFEPRGLDITIHSLGLDDYGNLVGAPPGYRQFFADELSKSIGL